MLKVAKKGRQHNLCLILYTQKFSHYTQHNMKGLGGLVRQWRIQHGAQGAGAPPLEMLSQIIESWQLLPTINLLASKICSPKRLLCHLRERIN